ncbi:DUF4231 domain-containing protein [Actinosynnema sp. NPDC023926]
MTDADLPGLVREADDASRRGQRSALRLTRTRLLSAVAAGLFAAFDTKVHDDFYPWWTLAMVAFAVALVAGIMLWFQQPERRWYAGRTVAEEITTLAWRYAAAGAPFPADVARPEALFRERVVEVVERGEQQWPLRGSDTSVTPAMTAMRAAPFEQRRSAYLENRIRRQQQWYAERADTNRTRATQWRAALVVGEVAAVVLAGGRAFGEWSLDLSGMFAAVVAGGAAWLGMRRHSTQATSYTSASRALVLVLVKLEDADEASWPEVVAEAEELIDREHRMWLASRPVDS